MSEQRITKWLENGYPMFKEHSGLPAYLLPERSFSSFADQLGDNRILEISRPLNLDIEISSHAEKLTEADELQNKVWHEACLHWPLLVIVEPVIYSLLDACDRIVSQFDRGKLEVDPVIVCRNLMILAFAPFVPQGRPILEEIAAVLDSNHTYPAELITQFADAAVRGDFVAVTRVNDCISNHQQWIAWFGELQKQAISFPHNPRLIAITPPLSDGIADVLATMIKEGPNDRS